MDIQAAGAGAGGGLFAAVLAWLGFNKQQERQDRDIENIQNKTVWRETCAATHKAVDERLTRMESKMDDIHNVLMKRARGK